MRKRHLVGRGVGNHRNRRPKRLRGEALEDRLMLDAGVPAGLSLTPDVLAASCESSDGGTIAVHASADVAGDASGNLASDALVGVSTALARFTSAEELVDYLVQDALERYRDLFGQPVGWPGGVILDDPFDGALPVASAPGHSDTNTQVAGVDEADLVETDGNYLYVLSDQELVILNSGPGEELQVTARMSLDGWLLGEYLYGDRLTVLSMVDRSFWPLDPVDIPLLQADCPVPCQPPRLQVTVLDVSDRQGPAIVQQTELDGWLVDSRSIDGFVLLVVRDDFGLPGPMPIPVTPPDGEPGVAPGPEDGTFVPGLPDVIPWLPRDGQYVYETEEEYLARIGGRELELAMPEFSGYGADGELAASGLLVQPTDLYRPVSADDQSLVSVVVFDASSDAPGPVSSIGVPFPYVSEIYASRESLYLLKPGWWMDEETSILKFDFDPPSGSIDLSATGSVPGRVLNQFSVDEYNGYLRIATTQDWGDTAQNNLYVLQQIGEELAIAGRLEGLAPGEQIYSARFLGDRAFLVTFRVIDPLFAVDLSDPTQPQLRGELEIPGFSNYLHSVGEDFLIGIGREVDQSTGRWGPPQVSLFDVRELSGPALLDRFTIDVGEWAWSEALNDHHAVAYFPEFHVLAIPISSAGQWVVDERGMEVYLGPRTDLWVFQVDVAADASAASDLGEIRLLGRIEHDLPVRRSVRIEDLLYVVSADTVSAHEILKPASEIARVHFRIEYLDPVDFVELPGRDLRTSDLWCSFQTIRKGLLTLQATLLSETQGLSLSLYDEQLNLLASSALVDGCPRIDWQAEAATTYYLQVTPLSEGMPAGVLFDLCLANLLSEDGGQLTVYGTDADDQFEIDTAEGLRLAVNGLPYSLGAGISSLTLDAADGNDTALLRGDDGGQTLELWPGHGVLSAENYTVSIANTEAITVDGKGGPDLAVLHDDPADKDKFRAYPDGARLEGEGYSNKVTSFACVRAYATEGGGDVALLYGVANQADTLKAWPDRARYYGLGFSNEANSFDYVHVYATEGDGDVALLHGAPGQADTLKLRPEQAVFSGAGFYNRALSFDYVHGYGTDGDGDVAGLYDNPTTADTFQAWPDAARFVGQGFYNRVKSFDYVHAYATEGNGDVARLYDNPTTADTFQAWPNVARFVGQGFYNRVKSFDYVHAYATPGGKDVAKLYDAAQTADTFQAWPDQARLYHRKADGSYSFYSRVLSFRYVLGYATQGGNDVAELYDSEGKDTLVTSPQLAKLYNRSFFNQAKYFRNTYSYSTKGGKDSAVLYDSALEACPDHLEANAGWARLSNALLGYAHWLTDFEAVTAKSSNQSDTKDVNPDALDFVLYADAW